VQLHFELPKRGNPSVSLAWVLLLIIFIFICSS